MKLRIHETHLADHKPPLDQRNRLEIDMQAVKTGKELITFALLDRQTFDIQCHGKWVDANLLDHNRTVQEFARLFNGNGLDHRRQNEETEECKNQRYRQKIHGIPKHAAASIQPCNFLVFHNGTCPR